MFGSLIFIRKFIRLQVTMDFVVYALGITPSISAKNWIQFNAYMQIMWYRTFW